MSILGIDEVGRGPWAGPLVMGAVVLKMPIAPSFDADDFFGIEIGDGYDPIWDDLADSKVLTERRRDELNKIILKRAAGTGLGWVPAEELDEIGYAESLRLACRRAVRDLIEKFCGEEVAAGLVSSNMGYTIPANLPFSEIIIDGTVNFLKGTPLERMATTVKKADQRIKDVSAASIIAKVARDAYMREVAKEYPQYGFEQHVGYGTRMHQEKLLEYGPCPEHRISVRPVAKVVKDLELSKNEYAMLLLKRNSLRSSIVREELKNTTSLGQKAERLVAEYLRAEGHKILAKNYKTRFYEIDLISAKDEKIYFTEVKYRVDNRHGGGLEAITRVKRTQMELAATAFMKYLSKKLGRPLEDLPAPRLAVAAVYGEDFQVEGWFELTE